MVVVFFHFCAEFGVVIFWFFSEFLEGGTCLVVLLGVHKSQLVHGEYIGVH